MQKLDYVNILIYFKESTMSTYDRKSRRAKLLRIYKLSLSGLREICRAELCWDDAVC